MGNIKSQLKEAIKSRILIGLVPPLNRFCFFFVSFLFFFFLSKSNGTKKSSEWMYSVGEERSLLESYMLVSCRSLLYILENFVKIRLGVRSNDCRSWWFLLSPAAVSPAVKLLWSCCLCSSCWRVSRRANLLEWQITTSTRFYYETRRLQTILSPHSVLENLTQAAVGALEPSAFQFLLIGVCAREEPVNCVYTVALMHQII